MKLKLVALMVVAAMAALMGAAAYAMPVEFEGGRFRTSAVTLEDETGYGVDVESFQLIGRDEDGEYLIFADGQYLKVNRDNMATIASALGLSAVVNLPKPSDFETLARGSKGDAVRDMQKALIAAGYINGAADGDFGGQSQRAVSAFQKDMGLEETGEADALLQMLILSVGEKPAVIQSLEAAAAKYDVIAGKTNANLEGIIASGLDFEYDDIAGTGVISDGSAVEYSVPDTADIDQRDFTLRFMLYVRQQDDGEVTIHPAVMVNCLCVRRPMVTEITLKSGDERYTVPVDTLENGIQGTKSVESAIAILDDDVAAMLANVSGEGELRLRIAGRYDTFDIDIPEENLASISQIGSLGMGLY